MVTLVLIVMCGVLGLVVDLGWSYYIKKSAQAAADSAALAAVKAAFDAAGQPTPYTCGVGITCQSVPAACAGAPPNPPTNNLEAGCLYAKRNGFFVGGNGSRQNVTIAADTTSPPPTVPGVTVYYWATVRVGESIPQLFSSVLGYSNGFSSARATAAIADSVVIGSLYTLNRESDPGTGRGGPGNDIYVQGNSSIDAGGIIMASNGSGGSAPYAGHAGGAATVTGTSIAIRGAGTVDAPGKFSPAPQNGFGDVSMFKDPMRGKGQPPAPTGLPEVPVAGGTLSGDCSNPPVLTPGSYYATTISNGQTVASGQPISISGCVKFGSGSGSFGNYVFFGGIDVGGDKATFSPGRYVLAGTTTGTILNLRNKAVMQDNTPLDGTGSSQPNTDAGEIFVFTDASYPGLQVPTMVQSIQSTLKFGDISIQSGNKVEMNLHGLNKTAGGVPNDLLTFAPTVFWQDQRNSYIKYTPDGYIDTTSCGTGYTLDNPCPNNDPNAAPEMHLQASPKLFLYGLFYQPRGAFLTFQGHGHIATPLQMITGAVSLVGGPTLTLQPIGNPLVRRVVALIE